VTGYTVVDDLLSGTSLRIISAIILSIPLIGTWAHFALFGGDFPGEVIIGRLYVLHVLLVPGIMLALVAVHLLLTRSRSAPSSPARDGPSTTSSATACSRRTPARPPVCSS
jgi:ubiquinol-cytochrome c reductase cytochrome b subunit